MPDYSDDDVLHAWLFVLAGSNSSNQNSYTKPGDFKLCLKRYLYSLFIEKFDVFIIMNDKLQINRYFSNIKHYTFFDH